MFSVQEKQWLLLLARRAVERFARSGEKLILAPSDIWDCGQQTAACSVTLTNDFELRGCIGSLVATKPLYQDVIDNAVAAGFEDPRFFPLDAKEIADVSIEISVVSQSKPLLFTSPDDLLDKLTVGVDGVVLSVGNKSATYLPQVWDEILEKENFLSSLCVKADLPPTAWRGPGVEIKTYHVEAMSE